MSVDHSRHDNNSLIYSVAALVLIIFSLFHTEENRSMPFLMVHLGKVSSQEEFYFFVYTFSVLVERLPDETAARQLVKANKWLSETVVKKMQSGTARLLVKELLSNLELSPSERKTKYNNLLLELISWVYSSTSSKVSVDARVTLIRAYILYQKLGLKWRALYTLRDVKRQSTDQQVSFQAELLIGEIVADHQEEENRKLLSSSLNVSKLLQFQVDMAKFVDLILSIFDKYAIFWSCLLQRWPPLTTLKSLGQQILKSTSLLKSTFTSLSSSSPSASSSLKTSALYSQYLLHVQQDVQESSRLQQKVISTLTGSNKVDAVVANGERECVFVVGGEPEGLGVVKGVSSEVLEVFGFLEEQIVGVGVERIMPYSIGKWHLTWMRKFFADGKERVMNKQRRVYPIVKEGTIIPCQLSIKIHPDFSNGLNIVGVLKPEPNSEDNPTMLIDGNSGNILAVNTMCKDMFGISPENCEGAEFNSFPINITQVIPRFSTVTEFISKYSENLTINTKFLQTIQGRSFNSIDNLSAYGSHAVKVINFAEQFYLDEDFHSIEVTFKPSDLLLQKSGSNIFLPSGQMHTTSNLNQVTLNFLTSANLQDIPPSQLTPSMGEEHGSNRKMDFERGAKDYRGSAQEISTPKVPVVKVHYEELRDNEDQHKGHSNQLLQSKKTLFASKKSTLLTKPNGISKVGPTRSRGRQKTAAELQEEEDEEENSRLERVRRFRELQADKHQIKRTARLVVAEWGMFGIILLSWALGMTLYLVQQQLAKRLDLHLSLARAAEPRNRLVAEISYLNSLLIIAQQ